MCFLFVFRSSVVLTLAICLVGDIWLSDNIPQGGTLGVEKAQYFTYTIPSTYYDEVQFVTVTVTAFSGFARLMASSVSRPDALNSSTYSWYFFLSFSSSSSVCCAHDGMSSVLTVWMWNWQLGDRRPTAILWSSAQAPTSLCKV